MGMKYFECSMCGCQTESVNTGECLKTYYIIERKAVCEDCAKKLPGRCPVCGDIKGWCNHKEGK